MPAETRTYTARIATRTTDKQREAMARAAKRSGLDLGTWARVVLIAAASPNKANTLAGDTLRACIASAGAKEQ